MNCPFRVNVEMDYETRMADGKTVIVQVGQREEYPECYQGDCPFYNYLGFCKRTDLEENE